MGAIKIIIATLIVVAPPPPVLKASRLLVPGSTQFQKWTPTPKHPPCVRVCVG